MFSKASRIAILVSMCAAAAAPAQSPRLPTTLPDPTTDPLAIDPAKDPILQLARSQASEEEFRAVIGAAVTRHPGTLENRAMSAEARALFAEAEERRLPSIDVSVQSYKVISRDFSNDP